MTETPEESSVPWSHGSDPFSLLTSKDLAAIREGRRPPPADDRPNPLAGVLLWHQIRGGEPTDKLIKRLMGSASLVVIAGPTGSAKTFLALDASVHVAMGWEWLGRKVQRVGVLYVAAEGQAGLIKRIEAIRRHYGIDDDTDVAFALYPAPVDLVSDAAGAKRIVAHVRALNDRFPGPVGLIVIDTLARCFGNGDESATQDMNTFVTRCDGIRTATGATILVVHHFGKDESKGMRGSVALKAAADTVIEVTGTEGIRTARVEKQKDGAAGESFTFTLQPVDLDPDEDGEPVTSCVVMPSAEPAANVSKRRPLPPECVKAAEYLTDLIVDHGAPQTGNNIPTGMRAVKVGLWRDTLKQRGLHTGDDAGRKWFERTRNRLIGENRIAIDGDFVWSIPGR